MELVIVLTTLTSTFTKTQFAEWEIVVAEVKSSPHLHLTKPTSNCFHHGTCEVSLHRSTAKERSLGYGLLLLLSVGNGRMEANQQYADIS